MKTAVERIKGKEHLIFRCRGEYFIVNGKGQILQRTNTYNNFDNNWEFLGVSTHHWHNHIVYPFEDIWENPLLALKGYVWDKDHGTTREWGGSYYGHLPKIEYIRKVK